MAKAEQVQVPKHSNGLCIDKGRFERRNKMKTTKAKTEAAVHAVDGLIKDMIEDMGLFCYASQDLIRGWGEIRNRLATSAADIISGNVDKNKPQVFRGYATSVEVASTPKVEDKAKTIELQKGKGPVQKLFVKVFKRE